MIHLAELNKDNICVGVKTVMKQIGDTNHVAVDTADFEYYSWRKYDKETGTWSGEKYLPDRPAIQLEEFEQLKADKDNLKNQVDMMDQMFSQTMITNANLSKELKDTQAINSDLLLKLAKNGIN